MYICGDSVVGGGVVCRESCAYFAVSRCLPFYYSLFAVHNSLCDFRGLFAQSAHEVVLLSAVNGEAAAGVGVGVGGGLVVVLVSLVLEGCWWSVGGGSGCLGQPLSPQCLLQITDCQLSPEATTNQLHPVEKAVEYRAHTGAAVCYVSTA